MAEQHKHSIRDSFIEFTTSLKNSIRTVKDNQVKSSIFKKQQKLLEVIDIN